MRKIFYIVTFLIIILGASKSVMARSGCCSHHGGVCGCGCCDGTSLSTACAPYYPNCNAKKTSPTKTNDSDGGSPWTGAIAGSAVTAGLLGGGYWVYKNTKK